MPASVVLLGTASPTTSAIVNRLERDLGPLGAIVFEEPIAGRALLRARARRLGRRVAAGQLAFRVLVQPLLARRARARLAEIARTAGLDTTPPPPGRITRVASVNDAETERLLRELAPRVVVVAGTRIIAERVLEATPATFLNMHAGMTPRYRGTHGGYWALAQDDAAHCGVTVHVVDPGVDTGDVVAQARIEPTAADSFATYPLLQCAAGLPLLVAAVGDALEGRLEVFRPTGPTRQWYHPTAWQYVAARVRRGIR